MNKTLFVNLNIVVDYFKRNYNLELSNEFISIADKQLSKIFEQRTGIEINPNRVCFSLPEKNEFYFSSGKISNFFLRLYVNHHWNDCSIQWVSLSGKIYLPSDTVIDTNDLLFSFEQLDVKLIYEQMYSQSLPFFEMKGLPFELIVQRINKDCIIEFEYKSKIATSFHIENFEERLNGFISEFNIDSESKDRKFGVVYNWRSKVNGQLLVLEIDLGSAGYYFLKQLLFYVAKLDFFTKVSIV